MTGLLAFVGCVTLVCVLSIIDPDTARWLAIGSVGAVIYVASALPRRKPKSSRVRAGSSRR